MTAIDLSHRIIQTPPSPPKATRFHALRRSVQAACVALVILLPLTDGLRLDTRRGVFYFGWHKLAAHDSLLIFWITMLAVWALVIVSFLYGRLWCGYVCPQTLASDFADSLKRRLDRAFHARPGRPHFIVSRGIWSAGVVAAALGISAVSVCYWIAPAAVGRAVLAPASDPVAAALIFGIAAILAADMLWVRRKLCAGVCQYGALLGVLADKNTLAVRYLDERQDDCIKCGRCEAVCPMEIDIKKGVGQIGCIGCGECVDACSDILGRRGVPGLIEYRYGVEPDRSAAALSWPQRVGLWDKQRAAVVLTGVACAGAIGIVAWAPFPSHLTIMANGAVDRSSGEIRDGYTLSISNGSPHRRIYSITLGDPMLRAEPRTLVLDGHDSVAAPVNVIAPSLVTLRGSSLVTTLTVTSGRERIGAPIVFVAPRS